MIFLLLLLILVFGATPALAQPEGTTDTQGTVAAVAGDKEVSLTWQAVEGASSYRVYIAGERYPSGDKEGGPGDFYLLAETAATAYTDTRLNNGYYYFYKVAAVVAGGGESWLNEVR